MANAVLPAFACLILAFVRIPLEPGVDFLEGHLPPLSSQEGLVDQAGVWKLRSVLFLAVVP